MADCFFLGAFLTFLYVAYGVFKNKRDVQDLKFFFAAFLICFFGLALILKKQVVEYLL